MISLIIYELTIILLYLALRALMPELFVVTGRKAQALVPVTRRRVRLTRPHFARQEQYNDPGHSAGMGMMMH